MRIGFVLVGRGLGLAAVACALVLSLPGIEAVRADDGAPDASVQEPPPNASLEGFAAHLERTGGESTVVEQTGPTCNAANGQMAAEMAHQAAIAKLRARLMAQTRARAEAGETPDVVVLNGSGYNYGRPGMGAGPSQPGGPAPR